MRTAEMENVFGEEELFAEHSRSILNTRSDVGYVRLLDRNGVLEKSFGVQDDKGFEKLTLKGPEAKTVLVGIRTPSGNGTYFNIALWSLLTGSLLAVALSFFLRAMNARSLGFLGDFSDAMRRLSRGDYSARLDASITADPRGAELAREFNEMASSLAPVPSREKAADGDDSAGTGDASTDPEETAREDSAARDGETQPSFRPKIVFREQESNPSAEVSPGSEARSGPGTAETVSGRPAAAEDDPPAVSRDALSREEKTGVSVLVARIVDFDTFVRDLEPSEIDFLTAEYRKSLSNFVVSFGGVVETVLQDEVVAFFSDAGDGGRKAAELKSVCCAVEIMQFFGGAEDREATAGKFRTKVKTGISSAVLSVRADSGVFAEAEAFASEAKALCDGARGWSIFVSKDFRESVKEYLEVRRESVGGRLCYAVTGVEEDALETYRT